MFETISKGFRAVKHRFQGKRELTAENIEEALRDIRVSLLEADVDFQTVRHFIATVKEKSLGEIVQVKAGTMEVTPGDHFVKICHDELEALMGPVDTSLDFAPGITKVMMIGLQGSGKTTTAGKLALKFKNEGRKPLLVAADIYRPAAVQQLEKLGESLEVPVFKADGKTPPEICTLALDEAKNLGCDLVIFDTAGRLAIDEQLMTELTDIKAATKPENIFLVVDSMIGQDAVRTAAQFDQRIGLSGFIMTKLDGDARGGAALSIKAVTGKPIKFLGVGEKLDGLEEFRPDGLASRIMGFGDIVGLVNDFERVVDEEQAAKDAQKLLSGRFDMLDFLEQIRTIRKMGSLKELFEKLPFFGDGLPQGLDIDESALTRIESMIQSMTPQERKNPDLIEQQKRRATRIARGSGTKEDEIIALVDRFKAMRKVMGALGSGTGGILSRLPGFKQISQLRQLKNMDLQGMFQGDGPLAGLGSMIPGGMGGGMGLGMPGMPGMPGLGGFGGMGMPGGMQIPGLPKGYTLPGMPGAPRKASVESAAAKAKARDKNKLAKAARKKQRK